MIIAVPYEFGLIYQHFGHSEAFKLYETDGSEILDSKIHSTEGQGHEALAGFLKEHNVDALICGGIGGGAKSALDEKGIRLYAGVTGAADAAVKALLAGTLVYRTDASCDHHHEGGEHNCGSHCAH